MYIYIEETTNLVEKWKVLLYNVKVGEVWMGEGENQYEIILARASAKLPVINQGDKQMNQRKRKRENKRRE